MFVLVGWYAPAGHAQDGVRYFNTGWDFDDVDVARLVGRLRRVGINIPVTLTGRVSGRLSVGAPWGALNRARAWRLGGVLTSPRLAVNGFTVRDLSVDLQYRDGALGLESLKLRIPAPGQAAPGGDGVLTGVARMELVPRGRFTATVDLAGFPLPGLGQAFNSLREVEGRVSGSLSAAVNVDQLRDVAAWDLGGPVTVQGLVVRGTPAAAGSVQLGLDRGVLAARQFQFVVGSTRVTSGATLNLRGEQQPWTIDAAVAAGDLKELLAIVGRLLEDDRLAPAVDAVTAGEMQGAMRLTGTLAPLAATAATGKAEVRRLAIKLPADLPALLELQPLVFDRAAFEYAVGDQGIQLTGIDADLAGGDVAGTVTIPAGDGATVVGLTWSGLQVSRLLAGPVAAGESSGRLDLSIPSGTAASPGRWQGTANLTLSELSYAGLTATELRTGDLALREGRLAIREFRASLEGEPLALSLDLQVEAPHTFSAAFNLPVVQLEWLRRVPELAGSLPRIEGAIALSGHCNGSWQPRRLQGKARVAGTNLRVAGRLIDSIESDVVVDGGELTLSSLQATLFGGQVTGSVAVSVANEPGGSAQLAWTAVDVGRLLAGVPLGPVAIAGRSSGTLSVVVPPGAFDERDQWSATARVELQAVHVYAWQFRQLAPIDLQLANGRLHTPELRAVVDGGPFRAAVTLGIDDRWTLDVRGGAGRARLDRITAIPALRDLQRRLGGRVDFETHVFGTLSPVAISATGSAAGQGIRFDRHTADSLRSDFSLTPSALTLTETECLIYGGRVTGGAIVPLDERAVGSATLSWKDIAADRLLAAFTGAAFDWQGGTSGHIELQLPPGARDRSAQWDFAARVEVPDLRAGRFSLASLTASATQQAGTLTYEASGRLLGGAFELDGNRDAAAAGSSGLAALGTARLVVREARVDHALELAARPGAAAAPVAGTFNLDVRTTAADDDWSWSGEMRLGSISVADAPVTTGFSARVDGNEQRLRLTALSGQLAGGVLGGSGAWQFAPRREGAFRVSLRGAETGQLAAAFGAEGLPFEGPLDVELLVRPGATWKITGAAAAGRAEAGGVALRNARLPIDVSWHPASGRASIHLNGASISLAGGRIAGRLTARRTAGWYVDGDFRFYRVDVAALTGSSYGRGRLTGTLTLDGRNVRSTNDLTGALVADLEDTQAARLPVVEQLVNFVPGISSSASTFSDGRVEAYLGRGVVRIEELTLASSQVQLYVSGQMTLAGRLRLKAIASTGDRFNPLQAQSLLTRFALTAVAPVSLIAQANDLLRNRVVHLAVGGTVSRPAVRVLPFESLREEAIRYFLRQATAAALPGAAAGARPR